MYSLLQNKIKIYFKKHSKKLKKNLKGVSKNLSSCFGISLIIILLGALIFGPKTFLKSLSERDFSFLTAMTVDKIFSQELFAEPVKNFIRESPEMTFVQANSLVGVSPPAAVNSKVLASIVEQTEPVLESNSRGLIEYIIEEGDTVGSISKKFDVSLETILWANDLSNKSVIKPGQKLLVLPISGAVHIVKDGDTIGTITEKYKGDVDEIIAFNDLLGEGDIYIGDMLVIPGGEIPSKSVKVAAVPLAESYFMFPVEGKISQGSHGAFGNAVDISNKCGKPVVAAAGGTVQRTGPVPIAGNIVTILHPNGVVTSYSHLSTITVVPGQIVGTGEIIAYVGNTGYTIGATGCHLHFEVRGASNFLARYGVGNTISW